VASAPRAAAAAAARNSGASRSSAGVFAGVSTRLAGLTTAAAGEIRGDLRAMWRRRTQAWGMFPAQLLLAINRAWPTAGAVGWLLLASRGCE
jgi:hypothetical protein